MRRIGLTASFLFALACASGTPPGTAEDAMRAWMSALNALDEAQVVGAFADDATAFFPVARADRADGRAAIAAVFHEYFKGNTKPTRIVPEDLSVQQDGDVAVITFNVRNPAATSRRTFVWRRTTGGWRIVHMHASNTPKPS